ncbi:acyltransferase family protein [Enterococcus hirae]|nr:acyltransferase family protein [Enterococcus hirae]
MNERKVELDILKGIGIIFMIMGHIEYGNIFNKLIYGFHMVLFICVSGFLYKDYNGSVKSWLRKKGRSLLVPYLTFGALFLAISLTQGVLGMEPLEDFKSHFINFLWINTDGLAVAGAIWYLTAIFIIEFLFFSLNKKVKNRVIKVGVILVIFILGIILGNFGIRLPWAIDVSFVGLFFYSISVYLKKYERNLKNIKTYDISILLVLGVCCILFNDDVNLRMGNYGNPFLFVTGSLLTVFVIYRLALKISKYKNIFVNEISYIGKKSLVYLCLNEFVLFFLKRLIINTSSEFIELISRIVVLLITLLVLHIIDIILEKTPFRIMLGKVY